MHSRRKALQLLAGAAAATMTMGTTAPETAGKPRTLKGNIRHSVCKWCYPMLSVDELGRAARHMGIESIELLGPDDWPTLARHDLICAMAGMPGRANIPDGWNRPENNAWLTPLYLDYLPKVANAGYPNAIVMSGNRAGLDDEAGLEHCVQGLRTIIPLAERLKVTVCMELLNSKVNHQDYQCDRTEWGVELVRRIGSDHFRLLYDIYHMQIMEGDIIRTIRENHSYIAHYHTGGNPGRNEIDDTQEIFYPAVMRAIVETGFKGFVAQEFIPTRAPLSSLGQAVLICDV